MPYAKLKPLWMAPSAKLERQSTGTAKSTLGKGQLSRLGCIGGPSGMLLLAW